MSADRFLLSMHFVLPHECAYAPGHDGELDQVVVEDVPGDAGGLTKYGIDQASHPGLDIRNLTLQQAINLYHDGEWTKCRCDDLPTGYDTAVFDCAVNQGPGEAAKLLQRALDHVNNAGLAVDGFLGPATIAAAQQAGAAGLKRFFIERQMLYFSIVDNHPGDRKFLQGWLNRINDLAKFLGIDLQS